MVLEIVFGTSIDLPVDGHAGKMAKASKSAKQANEPTKQLKVFLTAKEHTVVSLAANMGNMTITDYMKRAVIEQAKKDAKSFARVIDDI